MLQEGPYGWLLTCGSACSARGSAPRAPSKGAAEGPLAVRARWVLTHGVCWLVEVKVVLCIPSEIGSPKAVGLFPQIDVWTLKAAPLGSPQRRIGGEEGAW